MQRVCVPPSLGEVFPFLLFFLFFWFSRWCLTRIGYRDFYRLISDVLCFAFMQHLPYMSPGVPWNTLREYREIIHKCLRRAFYFFIGSWDYHGQIWQKLQISIKQANTPFHMRHVCFNIPGAPGSFSELPGASPELPGVRNYLARRLDPRKIVRTR